jgi:hypothetical protein
MATPTPPQQPATPSGSGSSDLFDNPIHPTGLPAGVNPEDVQQQSETDVSPEEQKQYDQIVRFAAGLIYKNPKQTLASLNQNDMPIHKAVGRVGAQIAQVIEDSAAAKGDKLDPTTFWHAGSEIISMLMDLGTQAKVFQLDPESDRYQHESAMAMMEAEKIVGEKTLQDKKLGPQVSAEAQDAWSWNIAKEVDGGQASPEYMKQVEAYKKANDPITAGVRRALGPQS